MEELPAILLIGILLPGLIVSFDWVFLYADRGLWGDSVYKNLFALCLAVQTAILSFAAGAFLKDGILRWSVFLWGIALLHLMVFLLALASPHLFQSLIVAELGFLAVWGILSAHGWEVKTTLLLVALCLCSLAGQTAAWIGAAESVESWVPMIATIGLSGVLWLLGFRIEHEDAAEWNRVTFVAVDPSSWRRFLGARFWTPYLVKLYQLSVPQGARMQFSIAHLFVWMTALSPVLAVVRVVDWAVLNYLGDNAREILVPVHFGAQVIYLAAMTLVALWAALGEEPVLVRVPLLCGLTLVLAWLLGVIDNWLATILLAALLLFFRAMGQRLIRVVVIAIKKAGGPHQTLATANAYRSLRSSYPDGTAD